MPINIGKLWWGQNEKNEILLSLPNHQQNIFRQDNAHHFKFQKDRNQAIPVKHKILSSLCHCLSSNLTWELNFFFRQFHGLVSVVVIVVGVVVALVLCTQQRTTLDGLVVEAEVEVVIVVVVVVVVVEQQQHFILQTTSLVSKSIQTLV